MLLKGELYKDYILNEWCHGHFCKHPTSGGFPHPTASWLRISPWHVKSEHVCLNMLRNMWQPQSDHNTTGEWGTSTQNTMRVKSPPQSVWHGSCQTTCQAAVKTPGALCAKWLLNVPTCCWYFRSYLLRNYNGIGTLLLTEEPCPSTRLQYQCPASFVLSYLYRRAQSLILPPLIIAQKLWEENLTANHIKAKALQTLLDSYCIGKVIPRYWVRASCLMQPNASKQLQSHF